MSTELVQCPLYATRKEIIDSPFDDKQLEVCLHCHHMIYEDGTMHCEYAEEK